MATSRAMTATTLPLWRLSANKSLREIAEAVGIGGSNPARTLQRYETGERACPLEVAIAVQGLTSGNVTPESFSSARADFLRHSGTNRSAHVDQDAAPATSCPAKSEAAISHGVAQ